MRLWRRYLDWRQRNVRRIDLTADAFTVRLRGDRTDIRWVDVTRIAAFKRDRYTFDLLCLLVLAGDTMVEISEDDPGFADCEAEMERRLDISPERKLTVLFPAFETNATEIFARDDPPEAAAA